jgi:hypothetical protein
MERPGKQQQDPRIASAMDHVLAAERGLQLDIEAIKEAADSQLAEARLNARRLMERAEQRTADVHRRGKRQLEREIAKLKRAAAAETLAAEPDRELLRRMREAGRLLAARLTSGDDEH